MKRRVYLAGPSVFYPGSADYAAKLKSLAAIFGLEGRYPLDGDFAPTGRPDLTREEARLLIKRSNHALIRSCDAVLADYTPFRGLSMDPGTASEVSFAEALQKPVVGHTDDPRDYLDRVAAEMPVRQDAAGATFDENGDLVEDFGCIDNIMLCAGIEIFDNPRAALAQLALQLNAIELPAHGRPARPAERLQSLTIDGCRLSGAGPLGTRTIGDFADPLLAEIAKAFWQDPVCDDALPRR